MGDPMGYLFLSMLSVYPPEVPLPCTYVFSVQGTQTPHNGHRHACPLTWQ